MADDDRDPEEVRRELRWRRVAAIVLYHRLEDDAQGQAEGMRLALQECAAYDLTPSEVLFAPVLDLIVGYVKGADRERLEVALQREILMYSGIPGPPGSGT